MLAREVAAAGDERFEAGGAVGDHADVGEVLGVFDQRLEAAILLKAA